MNNHWLERTELLIKQQGINTLQKAHILIVGLGGVGSFAAEFIARAGVGSLTIVDGDCVSLSNINRQLPALHSTVGKNKTDVMAARLLDINPQLNLTVLQRIPHPRTRYRNRNPSVRLCDLIVSIVSPPSSTSSSQPNANACV